MAGFPTAATQPSLSGSYVPTLYASMLLAEFYKSTIFQAIANTEYEGQIKKFGDTVRIRTLPEITSKPYVQGQDLETETPNPGFLDLVMDKGRYWSFASNLVQVKQSDIPFIQKWAEHAAITQKVAIDGDVLSDVYADASACNKGATAGKKSASFNLGTSGSPLELTKTNILDFIVDCGTVLDEQDVPDETGRWFALPSWATGMIKKSDLKDASMTGDGQSTLRNGRIGMIDRFEIYRTNNLSTVNDGGGRVTNAMFGHKKGITFASQMLHTESLKNPKDFGDLHRSLQVFGYKVVKPEAVGHAYIARG